MPPVPFEEIQAIIERELKQPLHDVFDHFNPQSMAAASVAQVHSAYLKSGEKVAVKVIRPGIDKRIRNDIEVMYYFAARIEKRYELGRVLGAVNLVKEFERTYYSENSTCSSRRATSNASPRASRRSRRSTSPTSTAAHLRSRCW